MRLQKINRLSNGKYLAAHWANNRGRGSTNCTLSVIETPEDRAERVKNTKCLVSARTSSWAGDVNISSSVRDKLNITGVAISIGLE